MSTTNQLAATLQQIDAQRDEMQHMGQLSADTRARLGRKFRLEMNYHSNSIEGNELDFGDTKSLLLRNVTASGKPLKDHLEMRGHDNALTRLREVADAGLPITESLIREFHKILIVDPFTDQPDNVPGAFKDTGNYLYNDAGERVDFLPPEQVPAALNELINFVNNALNPPKARKQRDRRETYDVHPVVLAAQFHQRFIQIHPFTDGNGRMARIFMNLILLRTGFPPIVIRQEEKVAYYRALDRARDHDTNEFTLHIAQYVLEQQAFYLTVAGGAPVEEEEDWKKRLKVIQKSMAEDPVPIEVKSVKLLEQRYNDTFFLVYEELNNALHEFDKLYAKTDHVLGDYFGINYFKRSEHLNRMEDGWSPYTSWDNIEKFSFRLRWEALKNSGAELFGNGISVTFDCSEKYVYKLTSSVTKKPYLKKRYTEPMTDQERKDFVNTVAKQLVQLLDNQFQEIQRKATENL